MNFDVIKSKNTENKQEYYEYLTRRPLRPIGVVFQKRNKKE